MPNMSYCRMENTYHDLMDCYEGWDATVSESELEYRDMIFQLAKNIVEDFSFNETLEED